MAIRAGARALAADFAPGTGVGTPAYVIKPSHEGLTSSTTLQDDNNLFYPLVAGAKYEVEAFLLVSGPVAADVKTAWTLPAGSSGSRLCIGPTDTAAGFTSRTQTAMRLTAHGWATTVTYQNDTGATAITERGFVQVGATAGNIQLQWAQNTSNATATQVETNSYLKITRVA